MSKKYIYFYILLGFILHIIAVNFSIGFYNDDEHFQILEPVAHLMGLNKMLTSEIYDPTVFNSDGTIDILRWKYWEWKESIRIRPWLQPYIYFYFINIFKFLNITNPFTWTLLIKLFSSIFGYISIVYLFFSTKNDFFKKNNHFNYLLFFSFWFYPFLHSRTSSENLSFSFFLIGFCFLYNLFKNREIKFNYFLLLCYSFCLGLSLVIRFNLIFILFPFLLWVIIIKFDFKKITVLGLGLVLSLSFGLYIDSLYWDKFAFTYWRLFDVSLLQGIQEIFGTQPWWYYFSSTALELAPILSIIFILSLIIFWFKKPLNGFTWISLIPILIISYIPHKETRYIFPIYLFAPLFISYFFDIFDKIKFEKIIKTLIIFSNTIFLLITIFFPANGKVDVYNYIYKNHKEGENVYYLNDNPYFIHETQPYFYTSFLPDIFKYDLKNNLNDSNNNKYWIITKDYEEYTKILKKQNCKKKHSTYPENIINLNNNWKRLKLNWYIVYCND